ncbi:MAG TPA: hypothetical protein VJP06_06465 [Thermoplasmata archaeon]|nr:hypothetical protein [Thermoplasmata archaeon]
MEPRRLFLASFCFAWGGLVLLAAAPYAPIMWCCLGSGFVSVLFLIGQYHLAMSIVQDPHDLGSERRLCASSVFTTSIAASVLSFAISAWVIPQFPAVYSYSFWWRIDGLLTVVYGLYLFIPSVYAPILVGNGILFWMASRDASSVARPYLVAAAAALIDLAAIAFVLQLLWTPEAWRFFLYAISVVPGLTGPAYALAAFGVWREHRFSLGRFPAVDVSSRT